MPSRQSKRSHPSAPAVEGVHQALAGLNSLIHSADNPEALLQKACGLLTQHALCEAAILGLLAPEGGQIRLAARAGLKALQVEPAVLIDAADPCCASTLIVQAIQTGQPAVSSNLRKDLRGTAILNAVRQDGLRSAAVLPLRAGTLTLGALVLFARTAGPFRARQVAVLQGIADALALGLSHLRVEQERIRDLRELEALHNVMTEALAQADLGQLLRLIVEKATTLLDATSGGIYLCQPEDRILRCIVSYPTPPDYTGVVLRYGEGAAGRVAETGTPLLIPDYSNWPFRTSLYQDAGLTQALLSVPMMAHGAVTGVFHVWRGVEKPPFTQADSDFLANFASQAAVALENARLLDSAQRRLRQLTMLGEMTHAALELQSPDALLQAMAEPMARLIGADVCHLVLRDPEMPPEEAGLLRGTFARHPLSAAALEGLEARSQSGAEEHPECAHPTGAAGVGEGEDSPLRSVLRLSLQAGETHLGTGSLGFAAPHTFSAEEVSLCQQAADQMALALAKAFALQSERRRSEELEAVHHANLRLTSRLELRPVLEVILEQVVRLVGADDAHIFLYDGKQLTFGAALWAGQPLREGFSTPRPHGLTYTVARIRERVIVPDVDSHPLFEDYRWGGAIVGLPLFSGDRVTGVMTVAHTRPHIFQDRELRLIDLLADQAAVALENARLYERRAAEQKRIQLLFDVTQALSNVLDPLEILQRAVTLITDSLGGIFGEGFLLERGTDRLRLRALAGLPRTTPAALDTLLDMHLNKGLVGWIAAKQEPALLDDVAADSRWVFLGQQEEGVRSALGAPILAGEELLGVLMVFHKDLAAFDQGHLDVLVAIAQQVGLALSNAQRYQQTRRRLAEQTALQQVGQVINRRLEMRALLEEVVHQVRQVLGYPMVEILLVEREELVSRASNGWSQPGPPPRMRFTQGIVGRVVRTNQPAFAPNVRLDPDYIPTEPTTQSEIVVPLRKGGVVFGVLNVEASEVGSLTEDDLRLLTLLADQISVAIENAALYDHLRQHADELERIVAERTSKLAEALGQAQQADRVKSQFVSDVSHELRTPLSNIRLYLDLLRAGRPDRFEEYVDTLGRETDRLVRLIEDLLAISRLEAGASPMQMTPLDLNALAQSLVEDRRRLFAARGLQLEFAPQPDLPPVMADERMLSQVVANLLTNAMQYTASGSVTASTEARLQDGRPFSTLTIRDTGMGIPPDELPRIFERFFRGSNSRQVRAPGTGLGLAICREILERHGGGIGVESQVGRGSAFTIWLPADAQVQPSSGKIAPEPISRTIRFH